MRKFLFALLLATALTACGGGGGDGAGGGGGTPPTIDVTGTWSGSVTETAFGTNTATLNVLQSGASVTGTYSSRYGTGSISGSVSGNVASCTISPTGCTGTMEGWGTVTTSSTGQQKMAFTASGVYTCSGQTYNNTATGNLIKQ